MNYESFASKIRTNLHWRPTDDDLLAIKSGFEKGEIPQNLLKPFLNFLIRAIMPSADDDLVMSVIYSTISTKQPNHQTVRNATSLMLAIPEQPHVIDYIFSSGVISLAINANIAAPDVYNVIKENLANENETVQDSIRSVFGYLEKGDNLNSHLLDLILYTIAQDNISDEIRVNALKVLHNDAMKRKHHSYVDMLEPVWKLMRDRISKMLQQNTKLDMEIFMEYRANQIIVLLVDEIISSLIRLGELRDNESVNKLQFMVNTALRPSRR